MHRRSTLPFFLALLLTLASACRPSAPDSKFVSDWLRLTRSVAGNARVSPPVAARVAAYSSIALYEAYAADGRSRLQSLAGQLNGLWKVPSVGEQPVDGATVAAEAQRVVLDSLFGGELGARRAIDSLAAAQTEARRRDGVRVSTRDRSLMHGRELAKTLLAWAANDGFSTTRGRPWRATRTTGRWAPPDTGAMEPRWGALRTFALRSGDECAPPAPPAYSEVAGSPFWKMGRELYDSARAPNAEQDAIARFWAESPNATGAPGFHWISILDQVVMLRKVSADQAAEAYMLTSVSMADAFIGSWREKYRSMVARPATYVNRVFDRGWKSLVPPPPSPEYPSDHAVLSGAAAQVLVRLLGDSTPFTDSTQLDAGVPVRSFRGISHARDEAAISGAFGGIHYMPAIVNGASQGTCIGERVLGRLRTRLGSA